MPEVINGNFPLKKPNAVDDKNEVNMLLKYASDVQLMMKGSEEIVQKVVASFNSGALGLEAAFNYLLDIAGAADHINAILQLEQEQQTK